MKRKQDGPLFFRAGQHGVDRRSFFKIAGITTAGAVLGGAHLLVSRKAYADAGAVQRPIADFLDAQGTTSFFTPPLDVGDYVSWFSALSRPPVFGASWDYAGIANAWIEAETAGGLSLGTKTRGTVSERVLADGRAEVSVLLKTTNALSWAVSLDPAGDLGAQLSSNVPIFGYRLQEIVDSGFDVTPALGHSEFRLVFINTEPGADLPDAVVAFILGLADPAIELLALGFRGRSTGPLREGSGFPEGTPGMCINTQTGLLMTGFHGAVGDAFPAEDINIRAIGN